MLRWKNSPCVCHRRRLRIKTGQTDNTPEQAQPLYRCRKRRFNSQPAASALKQAFLK
uniref:Uncharacterized protein n=1 Tax=Conchiformibius kuhniae TaxID=211502 RepID=A0A8T9MV23_9NEIS|nr:hypothetical protein LVJ77_02320 [Conchiformibius kuhniae]